MTAQAGYYGSDAVKNRFLAIPSGKGKNEKYFMQVKKEEPNKGRMQVWNEEFGQDRMVGFLDPDTNVFLLIELSQKVLDNLKKIFLLHQKEKN
tara:strand:+ start:81 stop:359 length:279 start_codon:yes stop_codon:yes gene_type:complete